jgi:hypothetical protein
LQRTRTGLRSRSPHRADPTVCHALHLSISLNRVGDVVGRSDPAQAGMLSFYQTELV